MSYQVSWGVPSFVSPRVSALSLRRVLLKSRKLVASLLSPGKVGFVSLYRSSESISFYDEAVFKDYDGRIIISRIPF